MITVIEELQLSDDFNYTRFFITTGIYLLSGWPSRKLFAGVGV